MGEEDKLYGSVTTRDIAEALKAQGVTIDAKKLRARGADQGAGHDRGRVKLGRGVQATIKVWVVKKEKTET